MDSKSEFFIKIAFSVRPIFNLTVWYFCRNIFWRWIPIPGNEIKKDKYVLTGPCPELARKNNQRRKRKVQLLDSKPEFFSLYEIQVQINKMLICISWHKSQKTVSHYRVLKLGLPIIGKFHWLFELRKWNMSEIMYRWNLNIYQWNSKLYSILTRKKTSLILILLIHFLQP